MASSAFAILEGNKIVTRSNTITDHSRKIQEAEKSKLPARVGRKAMDLLKVARLPKNRRNSWRLF